MQLKLLPMLFVDHALVLVIRIARLAQLAPSIVESCAAGEDDGVTLERVSRRAIPQRWDVQCARLLSGR